jgi:hypothetical protein
MDWMARVRSRQRQRIFPLTSASRPALGPTQPPIQWEPQPLSLGVKRGRGMMLTTHPLLVPKLRKSRSYTSCHPNVPLWSIMGPLYLLFFIYTCILFLVSLVLYIISSNIQSYHAKPTFSDVFITKGVIFCFILI